jgi:hypothetical protein
LLALSYVSIHCFRYSASGCLTYHSFRIVALAIRLQQLLS